MNFQNVNSINTWLNLFSGNLLPTMNRDSPFPLFWKIHSVFVWILIFISFVSISFGCVYAPAENVRSDDALFDGFVIFVEFCFLTLRIRSRQDLVFKLIEKLNEILFTADENMKNIVIATLKPLKIPVNFYWLSGILASTAWSGVEFIAVLNNELFYYDDYIIPAAFSKQPFSFRVFILGSLFILIASLYIFLKKVGVDVYMMHLVLMVTVQYRYIALKLAMIFQEESESQEKLSPGLDGKKEKELKALCRHHNDVIYITSLLKELLSLNFSLIYVNSVLRFCFIGMMLSTFMSTSFWVLIWAVTYALGAIVQLYLLCSCVQQLLDASIKITDEAFHENWYLFQPSIKRILFLIIMSNNLECKISTFDKFNLSMPSFMKILNQSYTIALLFLRMR